MEYIDGRKLILESNDLLLMSPEIYHTSHPIGKTKAVNVIISKSFALEVEKMLQYHDKDNYLSYVVKNGDYTVFRNLKNTGIEQVISEITNININRKNTSRILSPPLTILPKVCFLPLPARRLLNILTEKTPNVLT